MSILKTHIDIEASNKKYYKNLCELRLRLIKLFKNDKQKEELLQEIKTDKDLKIIKLFYTMITSCKAVEFSQDKPIVLSDVLDKWNGQYLSFSSTDELIASCAVGYLIFPYCNNQIVLCAPPLIHIRERKLLEKSFDVVLGTNKKPNIFSGKTYINSNSSNFELPDWSYYLMAKNSIRTITEDVLRKNIVSFSTNNYVCLENLKIDRATFVKGLLRNIPVRKDLLDPPTSLNKIEKWKTQIFSDRAFAISTKHDKDMKKVVDIVSIWIKLCHDNKISSVFTPSNIAEKETIEENLNKLAKLLSVDEYITSYLEGVPLEDIIMT